jgi:hypothetical protein
MVRDQFFTLLLNERRAVEASLPCSTPTLSLQRQWRPRSASSSRSSAWKAKLGKTRLAEITALFEAREKAKAPKNGAPKEGHKQPARLRQAAVKPNRPHSRNLS